MMGKISLKFIEKTESQPQKVGCWHNDHKMIINGNVVNGDQKMMIL